jgi:hypothetical protein
MLKLRLSQADHLLQPSAVASLSEIWSDREPDPLGVEWKELLQGGQSA